MTDNVNVSWKENFRIMQLTDLHLVRVDGTGPEQETLDMVRDLIQAEKPDFIAITGELSLSDAADCCYYKFCRFMDSFDIPWGYAMGNHDAEWGPGYEALEHILYNSGSCLYRHGMPDTDGHGNYTISLVEGHREPVWKLYFLDTHAEWYLAPQQTAWYRQRRDEGNLEWGRQIPALAFMHVPFKEYQDIWDAGAMGVKLEDVCSMSTDSGMLEAMTEQGEMKGIFVGHDHVNDYIGPWKGTMLVYGRGSCAGSVTIDGIPRSSYLRPGFVPGCRMIILSRDSFKTYVRLKDGTLLYTDC